MLCVLAQQELRAFRNEVVQELVPPLKKKTLLLHNLLTWHNSGLPGANFSYRFNVSLQNEIFLSRLASSKV